MTKKTMKKVKKKATEETCPKLTPKEKRALEREDIIRRGPESPHYRAWLRSHLRNSFRRWPSYQALSANSPTKKLLGVSKRGTKMMLKHKQCSVCGQWFKLADLAQDHIIPCGSLLSVLPEEVGQFVLNLFCGVTNLRYVCDYTLNDAQLRFAGRKSCHYQITHGGK